MKMKKAGNLLLLITSLMVVQFVSLAGQSTVFYITDQAVTQGTETISVPVRSLAYNDLVSTQFAITWDDEVLQYRGLSDLNTDLGLTDQDNFNKTSDNMLRYIWFDPSVSGVTLPDSSVLFSLVFEVTGGAGSSSEIAFTEDGADTSGSFFQIEVASLTNVIQPTFESGIVSIETVTSTTSISPGFPILVQQCTPNPFRDHITIFFDLWSADLVQFSVLDANGRLVLEQQQHFGSGEQRITLDRSAFPAPGTYYCRLTKAGHTVVQKIIHLR